MRKLKLNLDRLRVQSFDTGPGMAVDDLNDPTAMTYCDRSCAPPHCVVGTVEAHNDTRDSLCHTYDVQSWHWTCDCSGMRC